MNKKILIPTLGLAALVGLGALGVSAVKANDTGNGFVQRIAERFGLNEEEVSTFVQEMREERKTQMQTSMEERLDQAVADGVITEEQKQALLDKKADMWAEKEQHREEMQAWFEEQGIDREALMQYGGFGHKGFRHWHMGK